MSWRVFHCPNNRYTANKRGNWQRESELWIVKCYFIYFISSPGIWLFKLDLKAAKHAVMAKRSRLCNWPPMWKCQAILDPSSTSIVVADIMKHIRKKHRFNDGNRQWKETSGVQSISTRIRMNHGLLFIHLFLKKEKTAVSNHRRQWFTAF